jgi:hypothetical protein
MRPPTRRARPAPEPVEVRLSLGDIKPLTSTERAEGAPVVDDDGVIETIDREAVAAQQEQPPDRPFSPEDLTESGIR